MCFLEFHREDDISTDNTLYAATYIKEFEQFAEPHLEWVWIRLMDLDFWREIVDYSENIHESPTR